MERRSMVLLLGEICVSVVVVIKCIVVISIIVVNTIYIFVVVGVAFGVVVGVVDGVVVDVVVGVVDVVVVGFVVGGVVVGVGVVGVVVVVGVMNSVFERKVTRSLVGPGEGRVDLSHCLARHRHQTRHVLVALFFGPTLEIGGDSIDGDVKTDHGAQGDPEVSDLEEAVEEGRLEVLHVALPPGDGPFGDVLPADDGGEENKNGNSPGGKNHRGHLPTRPPLAILGGVLDRAEAIDGDAEDGVDGAHAQRVVHRQPQVAQSSS